MLQRLLVDRFKMTVQRTTKEEVYYELRVAAGGAKLTEAAATPAAHAQLTEPGRPSPRQLDKNGFPDPPPGTSFANSSKDGINKSTFRGTTISRFVQMLSRAMGGGATATTGSISTYPHIEDGTGLKGSYDFTLQYDGPPLGRPVSSSEETLRPSYMSSILEKQLGLKLEQEKGTIEIIVIKQLEREPVPN
jgi:uncharacterized protein (TIGR03435 family)